MAGIGVVWLCWSGTLPRSGGEGSWLSSWRGRGDLERARVRRLSHVIDRVGERMAFVGLVWYRVSGGDAGESGEVGLAVSGGLTGVGE